MGEIKELGKYSEEYHIKVITEALNIFDRIYFYDPQENFTYLSNNKVTFFKELKKIDEIISNTTKGVIYIKGSNTTGINKYLKESDLIWKD
jgi:UDP-N-acetylmuramoyl-tripeptide--D-alanyl-D-alanine ligase